MATFTARDSRLASMLLLGRRLCLAALTVPSLVQAQQSVNASLGGAEVPSDARVLTPLQQRGTFVEFTTRFITRATNNVAFVADRTASSDLVSQLMPQLTMRNIGADWMVESKGQLNFVSYLRNPAKNTVLPEGGVNYTARVVDRWLSVDGSVDAITTMGDAYGVVVAGADPANRQVTYRERISPYTSQQLSPTTRLLLRSDNSWSQTPQPVGVSPDNLLLYGDSYVQKDLLRFDARGEPVGFKAEVTHLETRYLRLTSPPIITDTVQLSLPLAFDPTFAVEPRLGYDRAQYSGATVADRFPGMGVHWKPMPRSTLDAMVERRFFGKAWDVSLLLQRPFWMMEGTFRRSLNSYAVRLMSLNTAGSVEAMADRILQSSIDDPVARGQAVRDVMTRLGVPEITTGPTDIFSDRAQVEQVARVTMSLSGVRNSLSLRVYKVFTNDVGTDVSGADVALLTNTSDQQGATLAWKHRLSETDVVQLSWMAARTQGLVVNRAQQSFNRGVEIELTARLSNRTKGNAGFRRRAIESSTIGVGHESALFAGLEHRF
jgi:uncharacterized protein (PEP-CTERM system associated)